MQGFQAFNPQIKYSMSIKIYKERIFGPAIPRLEIYVADISM